MTHGEGRLVLVLGEAGIGKSRLLEALEAEARGRGIPAHVGRSYLSEQVLAFAPWIEALRAADVTAQPRILESLGPTWIDELARLLPDLDATRPASGVDAGSSQRLFEAVARLVSGLAAEQPRLILLEDVHWADDMSLRLLAFVARRVGSIRALVVATAREEELGGDSMMSRVVDELSGRPGIQRLSLSPLSREDTATLVMSLAPSGRDRAATALLAERMFAASGGNPFMVVETMRALADGAGDHATGVTLPERVKQVIAGRLARLGDRGQSLVATASVIGREFDFWLLQAASGLSEAVTAEEVEALVRRRVLRVVGERFDFVHDQVREVAYGQLLPPRRTLLHAAVARAIERLPAGQLNDDVERLAHHSFRGELWEAAVRYGRRAGHVAADRSASAQAEACFDRAIAALTRLPETRERLEQAFELRQLRGAHYIALGEREALLRGIEEAVVLAGRLGDQHRLATILSARANGLWFTGDHRRALESGTRAVALAEAIEDPALRISANLNLGMICASVGDHRGAAGLLARAVELLAGDLQRERLGRTLYPAVNARGELARARAELGEFDAARTTIDEAVRIAEALGHSTTTLVLHLDACHVLLCRGDFLDAIPPLEACLDAFRAAGFPTWSSASAAQLGYARAMTGRLDEGIPLLREGLELVAQGRRTREACFMTYLAEALLLDREMGDAAIVAEQALALSRERSEKATEARTLYLLGEIGAESREGPTAEGRFHEAVALATELGLRPLAAHCHLGLGKLYRHTGQREPASEYLTTATTMYREMGMTYWREQVEAENQSSSFSV
jgi:tetratricopeptide (TPR) repeat protein